MEFEGAAQRLARDQSRRRKNNYGKVLLSAKAKKQADFQKKQQERLRLERERDTRKREYMQTYMNACDRALGVKSLSSSSVSQPSSQQLFGPTSIWGNGDKIALPPSVLEHLTNTTDDATLSSPWTFRIGILNTNYTFPSSPLLQVMEPPTDDYDDDDMMMLDDDDDDYDDSLSSSSHDENGNKATAAYMDEMAHKYVAYTYASVVEFTQEEGHVGLPPSIASRLLVDGRVPFTRTKDPATAESTNDDTHDDDDDTAMKPAQDMVNVDNNEEQTPGHLAWGAFDIPDVKVEVSLVKLPKGRRCTVIPTMDAIRNGFFSLKDVKLVLEQSLSRTRATLSVDDLVHTWNRGTRYDLTVASVSPSNYHAISIINTDLEVDIGVNEEFERERKEALEREQEQAMVRESSSHLKQKHTSAFVGTGTGRVLSGPSTTSSLSTGMDDTTATSSSTQAAVSQTSAAELLTEPPLEQSEGVCTVQIRGDGSAGRRRFDVTTATLADLFAFAATLSNNLGNDGIFSFRLVTRFPRRVFSMMGDDGSSSARTLADCGIEAGQEMFMLERM